jgi:hypothetical protein
MDPAHASSAEISLRSIVPSGVDATADSPMSVLLAGKPLVAKSTNATTAFYRIKATDDSPEMSIQVSLFVARPPLVSHVVVWPKGGYFTDEPFIHSTHGGLILLSMAMRTKTCPFPEYYIYQPGCGHGGADAPSLELVPQFLGSSLVDEPRVVGLLSHGDRGGYYVAVLSKLGKGEFELYLFCSKMATWTIKKPLFLLEDGRELLEDEDVDFMPNNKVITVGGGVLAFVDLTKGILIGDVLEDSPEFYYITLPSEFCQPWTNYPSQTRDVSINVSLDGTIRIKFIELFCPITLGAWAATTWITAAAATSPWQRLYEWDEHCRLEARELILGDGVSTAELLPEGLEFNGESNFGFLFVDMPMLSLDEDNIVCFLAKHHYLGWQVWVISVDMVTKKLLGVHHLQMGRFPILFYSTISSHLNMSDTASGNGHALLGLNNFLSA